MDMDDLSVGARIRQVRRERRLNRREFAHITELSEETIRSIEVGRRTPTLRTLHLLAAKLGVPVERLLGQPDTLVHDAFEDQSVPLLRRIITPPVGVRQHYFPDGPRDPRIILGEVNQAWRLWQGTQYGRLADVLPALLEGAHKAVEHQYTSHPEVALLALSEVYNVTAELLGKLGQLDLAYTAAIRSAEAAERLEDPLMQGMAVWHLCEVYFRQGRADDALRAAAAAVKTLDAAPVSQGQIPHLSVVGALHLRAAIGAARMGFAHDVEVHLDAAADRARHIPSDHNHAWTVFNADNVKMHAVSVAVELEDPDTALARQERVSYDTVPSKERIARHTIEHVRALDLVGDHAGAMRGIVAAVQIAPEEARYQRFAREVVRKTAIHGDGDLPHLNEMLDFFGLSELN